jgi:hypothetical protein
VGERRALRGPDGAPTERTARSGQVEARPRRRKSVLTPKWHALNQLGLESGKRLQDIADEAFRDFLKKHRRPVTLHEALRESARMHPANDRPSATVHNLRRPGTGS